MDMTIILTVIDSCIVFSVILYFKAYYELAGITFFNTLSTKHNLLLFTIFICLRIVNDYEIG